jgi:hypothetical protein
MIEETLPCQLVIEQIASSHLVATNPDLANSSFRQEAEFLALTYENRGVR